MKREQEQAPTNGATTLSYSFITRVRQSPLCSQLVDASVASVLVGTSVVTAVNAGITHSNGDTTRAATYALTSGLIALATVRSYIIKSQRLRTLESQHAVWKRDTAPTDQAE